jgi:hypothetical protein
MSWEDGSHCDLGNRDGVHVLPRKLELWRLWLVIGVSDHHSGFVFLIVDEMKFLREGGTLCVHFMVAKLLVADVMTRGQTAPKLHGMLRTTNWDL